MARKSQNELAQILTAEQARNVTAWLQEIVPQSYAYFHKQRAKKRPNKNYASFKPILPNLVDLFLDQGNRGDYRCAPFAERGRTAVRFLLSVHIRQHGGIPGWDFKGGNLGLVPRESTRDYQAEIAYAKDR